MDILLSIPSSDDHVASTWPGIVAEFARRVKVYPGHLGAAYGFCHRHYEVQLLYEAGIVTGEGGSGRRGGAQRAVTTGGHEPAL